MIKQPQTHAHLTASGHNFFPDCPSAQRDGGGGGGVLRQQNQGQTQSSNGRLNHLLHEGLHPICIFLKLVSRSLK